MENETEFYLPEPNREITSQEINAYRESMFNGFDPLILETYFSQKLEVYFFELTLFLVSKENGLSHVPRNGIAPSVPAILFDKGVDDPDYLRLKSLYKGENPREAFEFGKILATEGYGNTKELKKPQKEDTEDYPVLLSDMESGSLVANLEHLKEILEKLDQRIEKENNRRKDLLEPLKANARTYVQRKRRLKRTPSDSDVEAFYFSMKDHEFNFWINEITAISNPNKTEISKIYEIKTPAAGFLFNGDYEKGKESSEKVLYSRSRKLPLPRKGELVKTVERITYVRESNQPITDPPKDLLIHEKLIFNAIQNMMTADYDFITPEDLASFCGMNLKKNRNQLTESQTDYLISLIRKLESRKCIYQKIDKVHGYTYPVPAQRRHHPGMTEYEEKIIESGMEFHLIPRMNWIYQKEDDTYLYRGWKPEKTGYKNTCPLFRIAMASGNYIETTPDEINEFLPRLNNRIGQMVFDFLFFETGYGKPKRLIKSFCEKYDLDINDKETRRLIKKYFREIGSDMKKKGFLIIFDDSHIMGDKRGSEDGYIRARSREHEKIKEKEKELSEREADQESEKRLIQMNHPALETEPDPDTKPGQKTTYRVSGGRKKTR